MFNEKLRKISTRTIARPANERYEPRINAENERKNKKIIPFVVLSSFMAASLFKLGSRRWRSKFNSTAKTQTHTPSNRQPNTIRNTPTTQLLHAAARQRHQHTLSRPRRTIRSFRFVRSAASRSLLPRPVHEQRRKYRRSAIRWTRIERDGGANARRILPKRNSLFGAFDVGGWVGGVEGRMEGGMGVGEKLNLPGEIFRKLSVRPGDFARRFLWPGEKGVI